MIRTFSISLACLLFLVVAAQWRTNAREETILLTSSSGEVKPLLSEPERHDPRRFILIPNELKQKNELQRQATSAPPAEEGNQEAMLEGVLAANKLTNKNTNTAAKTSNTQKPAAAQAASESKLARWIELQTATLGIRYIFGKNSSDVTTLNQLQHMEAFKGRFKFDSKGNYSINAGVFSGNQFVLSWNNTGIGKGQGLTNLYLKQLYFAAKPVKGLEVQYGGLYFLRGESTEITSYDNDGFLVGQRISVKRPKQFFFDEVSATYAYIGDFSKPNINKRFHRLKKSNYHQFLVSKNIGKRAAVSGDYTFQAGTETLREAVRVNTKELRVIDSFRFDTYQRMDVKPDFGFNLSGEKTLFKKLTLGGGFAKIDPNYGGLNSDRFNRGKRFYMNAAYALSPEFSVAAFATRGVGNNFAISNRTRMDVVFSYNLLKTLQRTVPL